MSPSQGDLGPVFGRFARSNLGTEPLDWASVPESTPGARRLTVFGGASNNGAMTTHILRLPFSLDPLIREAKERARRRRMTLVVIVLVIATAVTATVFVLGVAVTGRPASSPFGSIEGSQAAGEVVTGSIVHFHPNAHFWMGFGLANLSDRTVVVTNVQAVEPPHSFVHQTGTALLHWHVPPPCPTNECMPEAEGFGAQPVTATGPPQPLEVKPGHGEWRLGVQLDFITGTCAELTSPAATSPSHLLITFHVPNGPTERETVPLGKYRLYRQRAHASWVCPKPQR